MIVASAKVLNERIQMIPPSMKYSAEGSAPNFSDSEGMTVERGSQVRLRIKGIRGELGQMFAIGSIREDYLGYALRPDLHSHCQLLTCLVERCYNNDSASHVEAAVSRRPPKVTCRKILHSRPDRVSEAFGFRCSEDEIPERILQGDSSQSTTMVGLKAVHDDAPFLLLRLCLAFASCFPSLSRKNGFHTFRRQNRHDELYNTFYSITLEPWNFLPDLDGMMILAICKNILLLRLR